MGSRSTVGAPSLSKFATPAAESKRNLTAPGDCQGHQWKTSQRTHTHTFVINKASQHTNTDTVTNLTSHVRGELLTWSPR